MCYNKFIVVSKASRIQCNLASDGPEVGTMFCEITMTGSSYVWKALVDGTGFLGILQINIIL